jgi:hypothetical protein
MGQFEFWLFVSRAKKFKLTHHRMVAITRSTDLSQGLF